MLRKFECWHCHKHFEADDKNYVECPHCHSDNVEYASRNMKPMLYALYVVVGLAIVCAGVSLLRNCSFKSEEPKAEVVDTTENKTTEEINRVFENETGLTIPPKLQIVQQPTADDEGNYSLEVAVKYAPNVPYVFILSSKDGKEVARSEDGKFTNIPYSNSDGWAYDLWIASTDSLKMLCDNKLDLPGFVKIEKVNAKMTPAQLQKLIDTRDDSLMGVGENKYISPNCTLHFKGLPADAINVPKDLSDVYEKLNNEVWKSVKVVALDYDDTKHINSITLSVVVNNLNF